jgi:hypothetical protein
LLTNYEAAPNGRSWPDLATSSSKDAFEYDVRNETNSDHSARCPRNPLSAGLWIVSGYSDHGLPIDSRFTAVKSLGNAILAGLH